MKIAAPLKQHDADAVKCAPRTRYSAMKIAAPLKHRMRLAKVRALVRLFRDENRGSIEADDIREVEKDHRG